MMPIGSRTTSAPLDGLASVTRPDHITLDDHETDDLLRCLLRAHDLALATDNLDIVVMTAAAMDMLITKWEDRTDD